MDLSCVPGAIFQVLLKEHKDSMKKLSLEYVKLQKENEDLRKIIKGKEL